MHRKKSTARTCKRAESLLESDYISQLNKEKQEAQQYVSAEADQRKFITDLELKSLYSQGPVEGFVTVQVGDNIYEKLGGVEVIVEDGIVKKISTSPSQFDKVTKGSKVGA